MRIIFILILFIFSLAKQNSIEITSNQFEADNIKKKFFFNGNVNVTKGRDILKSDTLTVLLTKENKAKEYKAVGNSMIDIHTKENHYIGTANTIKYFPKKNYYELTGNAVLKDITNNKEIKGHIIQIDLKNQKSKILSNHKKPVKLIFEVEDK
jgi:lipopolysaccharide export system protein LptA